MAAIALTAMGHSPIKPEGKLASFKTCSFESVGLVVSLLGVCLAQQSCDSDEAQDSFATTAPCRFWSLVVVVVGAASATIPHPSRQGMPAIQKTSSGASVNRVILVAAKRNIDRSLSLFLPGVENSDRTAANAEMKCSLSLTREVDRYCDNPHAEAMYMELDL